MILFFKKETFVFIDIATPNCSTVAILQLQVNDINVKFEI